MLFPRRKWKDIQGHEGRYQVSNLGEVRSLKFKGGDIVRKLKPVKDIQGYLNVSLYKNNNKYKNYRVHRLVAQAFIPNPNNYPIINHKDENKTNNIWTNLEWCTHKYNANYGTAIERSSKARKGFKHTEEAKIKISEAKKGKLKGNKNPARRPEVRKKISEAMKGKKGKKVQMIDRDTGEILKVFECISDANEYLGKSRGNNSLYSCLRNKQKSAWGFIWKYIKED